MGSFNTLQDISRRKTQVARQIRGTRKGVRSDFREITHPDVRVPKFVTFRGLKKTYKIAARAFYVYKSVSMVRRFFKRH